MVGKNPGVGGAAGPTHSATWWEGQALQLRVPIQGTQDGNKNPHPAHLEGPRICLFPETSKGTLDSEGVRGLLGSGEVASHSCEEGLTGLSTFRANLISLCSF